MYGLALSDDGVRETTNMLSVMSLVAHDEGVYQCQVRSDDDVMASRLFFLYVTGESRPSGWNFYD